MSTNGRDEKIRKLRFRIAGLLADAIRHEERAESEDDPRSKDWSLEQSARKFEMAEWTERRLAWLLIGGD